MSDSARPILILQMQRIGDLILSFPLFLWLARAFPDHPVWVVAEEGFYRDLLPVSPKVVYVPWAGVGTLKDTRFEAVVNLSIRPEAARLAGELKSEAVFGPAASRDGSVYVHGDWQLYRASLVANNRYNLYHWADLNALDLIPLMAMRATRFDPPGNPEALGRKAGVFLGASEPAKRPGVGFWRGLLSELLKRGIEPVLFGGPMERSTAAEVLKGFGGPVHNTCGMLGLDEVAALGRTLKLFITPDTGPMHLAAWTGTPVLNLSLGNVNCWETGPYPPGHHVLRSTASCTGCWECGNPQLACHRGFNPARLASLAKKIMAGDARGLSGVRLPGLELRVSARNEHGLYHLEPVGPDSGRISARWMLSRLWTEFFGARFGLWDLAPVRKSWGDVAEGLPRLAGLFAAHLPPLGRAMSRRIARGGVPEAEFWRSVPPLLRPLTGYAHLLLQNTDFSARGWKLALELIERLLEATRP